MDVRITNIHADGDAAEEYLALHVDRDCDIGDYIIADTTYVSPNQISNELRHMFWFPSKQVEAGDTVILRTGRGTNTAEERTDGSTRHRFYWGLKSAVWNDTGDTAVLLKIENWNFKKAS